MNQERIDVLDPQQTRLRLLVASVDEHVANLSSSEQASDATRSLKQAWLELSKALALGAEPALRACPSCSRRIPREATRCRYCMARSDAWAPNADEKAQA